MVVRPDTLFLFYLFVSVLGLDSAHTTTSFKRVEATDQYRIMETFLFRYSAVESGALKQQNNCALGLGPLNKIAETVP